MHILLPLLRARLAEVVDLLHKEALFIDELFIFFAMLGLTGRQGGDNVTFAVLMELWKEIEKLLPVLDKNILNGSGFFRVGNENLAAVRTCARKGGTTQYYLKDMERLVLNVFALVTEQVHGELEMIRRVHVLQHDTIVGPVEQDLSKKLDGLPLGNVVRGCQKCVILCKELQEVRGTKRDGEGKGLPT